MKIISILTSLFLFFNPQQAPLPPHKVSQELTARITYYEPCAQWGNQVACPKTPRAQKGITVAAHPDFKFGTKIYIEQLDGVLGDGYFIVQDRGPAVTKKTASRGRNYVFDVFVHSREDIKRLQKLGDYMQVEIIEELNYNKSNDKDSNRKRR